MDIKASEIQGWMSNGEMNWLAERAGTCDLIIEIGAFMGRSTRIMGTHVRGKVITIDDFLVRNIIRSDRLVRYAWRGISMDKDWLYRKCRRNLADLIEQGKVEIMRKTSEQAVLTLRELSGKVDMVFIDGDHNCEAVKKDIINYKPLIRTGGILCGHDFAKEVKRAVVELLPSAKRVAGSIWAYEC